MQGDGPFGFATLLEMLAERAREQGEKAAFVFAGEPTTFAELADGVERFASRLLEIGVEPGERMLVALPNGREFFTAFYGVQRAGAVAVPLFPATGEERLRSFSTLTGARFLVTGAQPASAPAPLRSLSVVDSLTTSPRKSFPEVSGDDVAFLQYTSGSTGDPKGVELTHRNLLANLRHLVDGFQITPDDVFASWLPVHHDMGLILMTMVPFYLAAKLVLLPTSLAKAQLWLQAIEEHRATLTAAPDFAYRHCLRYVKEASRYDLTSLRLALNAAEPVRQTTIATFERAFSLDRVMISGYGLAEASVGVASWPPGRAPKVDARGLVSIGRAFPGVEMAILGGGGLAGPGEEGEVLVRSAATTRGYFRNPGATAELYWRDGYLRTGDVGYFDEEGDFFIVGRSKDIILHAGRNVAPQEVEEIVDALPGVRHSAALGIDRGGIEGEQIYVFAEVRPKSAKVALPELYRTLVASLHRQIGLRPARVYLLTARSIPRTANGKLRRAELKADFLDGALRRDGRVLFPDH